MDNQTYDERDIVVFKDEDGNDLELEVVDYFSYNGDEYAVLMNPIEQETETDEDGEEQEEDIYIMKVVPINEEEEEFIPIEDEELFQKLCDVVNARFECDFEDCDCEGDCDCGDEESGCDCGCH